MKRDTDAKPKVGSEFGCLGVRIPNDIVPDADAHVAPSGQGMSVNRSVTDLPFWFVPRRYNRVVEGAKGSNSSSVWQTGTGPFRDGAINAQLILHCESVAKGLVCPAVRVHVDQYQRALADTRDEWTEVPA